MIPRSLNYVAQACEAVLLAGEGEMLVRRVCTDSRHAAAGDLFFALQGDRFDGHNFLPNVARQGAAGVVVAQARAGQASTLPKSVGVLAVDDTRAALGRLAARYRSEFCLPVIAVAGSNGKTTTKDLLASVLRQRFKTLWSEASFNNDIGVPLTLLKLEADHEAAVLEVGTNHPGELEPLLQMIRPRYGILTNIGREHLEFFGDLSGVADEEGHLAEALPADGMLFVNGDNEWTPTIARRSRAKVVQVGTGQHNHWRARNVRVEAEGTRYEVTAPRPEFSGEYMLRVVGQHQVPNSLLATVAGAELGVSPDLIRRGLAECLPPKMRLQVWEAGGVRVMDDAYNANADSTLAALQTLRDLPGAGRRIAVLGDMAELGCHTEAAHRDVGRRAAELGISRLVAVGQNAAATGEAARAAGLTEVDEVANAEAAVSVLQAMLKPGDLVLIKASRAAGFERVGALLRAGLEPSEDAGSGAGRG